MVAVGEVFGVKAVFQRNQRVWVEAVGAWATIEKIVPIWAKGFDEPVRVSYDVGLGRDFLAHELKAEDAVEAVGASGERWRLLRAKNKWQTPSECAHHPFPGTYPVVVTDANDWGGWRTPGAEYDRDPHRIEAQARLMVSASRLHAIVVDLIALVAEAPEDAPEDITALALRGAVLERYIKEAPLASVAVEKDAAAA
ncbi:MAG: hypothetical protein JWM33_1004 [Caulobacteraceae bacterium]|nr:hypothetical protein [Caulobacteraceae bacterium]